MLDKGISVEVYPYPEDANAETLAGLVSNSESILYYQERVTFMLVM